MRWVNLSDDQKPEREGERERIIRRGGRVEACKDDNDVEIGPQRVWLQFENSPGLAMSRSFGDKQAQSVGVISEPEVKYMQLGENDKFIVLASDGVWEFLSNQQIVDLITPFYLENDAEAACECLIKHSVQMWKDNENNIIDDITVIVIFLDTRALSLNQITIPH